MSDPQCTPQPAVAVVIPCYRVREQILGVLAGIGSEVQRIFVVDDACPDESGAFVLQRCLDPRVSVIRHAVNQGVGGAMVTGYRAALAAGCDVIVKLDGDGQMDPRIIPEFVRPIAAGRADYVKGNRFFSIEHLGTMPRVRLLGNAGLSFLSKLSTGYWNLMDPVNGYTAIQARVLELVPLEKLDRRYFFETDLLFRLNTLRAVVSEVPMRARYADERSNLRIRRVLLEFPLKHLRCLVKRILYNYFLRDFNVSSIELVVGLALLLFGMIFGANAWYANSQRGIATPTGTVMLAVLPIILGVQLLLAAVSYDIMRTPTQPLHTSLGSTPRQMKEVA